MFSQMKYTFSKTCPSAVGSMHGETELTNFARAQGARRGKNMNREDKVGVKGFEAFVCLSSSEHVKALKSKKKDKTPSLVCNINIVLLFSTNCRQMFTATANSSRTLCRRFRSLNLDNGETFFSQQTSIMLRITSMWSYRASQKKQR